MDSEVAIFNTSHKISYLDATVVHTSKYNDSVGLNISIFIFNSIVQEVIFKLRHTGVDYRVKLTNREVNVYPDKEVRLIVVQSSVVGYIDNETNYYYYLTNNISRDLGLSIAVFWIWVGAFLLTLALLVAGFRFAPLVLLVPPAYWIYQRVLNIIITRKIDRVLRAGN